MVFKCISEILNVRRFAPISPDATLGAASDLMLSGRFSALAVAVDRDLVGIITERDILRHVSQHGGFATAPVEHAMTRDVICVEKRTSLVHALMRMQEGGFGHLPVLDTGGKVVGMLCRGDILTEYNGMDVRNANWSVTVAAE